MSLASTVSILRSQVIEAPKRPPFQYATRLFLAGTTPAKGKAGSDWRKVVKDAVSHLPVTVLDPVRPDWDDTWKEDITFEPFRQQVEWELEMQTEHSTLTAVYFAPDKDGMISLLELGLCLGRTGSRQQAGQSAETGGEANAGGGGSSILASASAVVACPAGYGKRGNVQLVCAHYGMPVLDTAQELAAAVVERVSQQAAASGDV